ncbi:Transmembrane amino acid transporter protein [Cryptosporidium felis]|nr:Transmembrane amino acid transporter protein [Cryptosporidium felis]
MSVSNSKLEKLKDVDQVEIGSIGEEDEKELKVGRFEFSKIELIHMGIGFITVFKAAIGTGILFSPRGVVNTGYVFSALIMLYYWILNVVSTFLLMQCADKVDGNYSNIATKAMGRPGRILLEFSIISTAISFGSIYATFVTNNIQDIIAGIYNCSQDYLNYKTALITFLQLVVYLPLVSARRIQSLAIVILISNLALISAIALVLVQSFRTIIKNQSKNILLNVPAFSELSNIPGFVGTAAYLWVCAPVTLSYYVSINNKRERKFFTWVYLLAIFIVFVFALAFTYLCAFAYGQETLPAITLNLPFTPIAMGGKILYSLSVLLSLPLMIFPMKEIFAKYSCLASNANSNSEIEMQEFMKSQMKSIIQSHSTISTEENRLSEPVSSSIEEVICDTPKSGSQKSSGDNYILDCCDFNINSEHLKTKNKLQLHKENLFPSIYMMACCVFIVFLGYILHDSLGNLINLIGGLFCVPLNIFLPALFHLIIFRKELRIRFIIIDLLLIISGVFTSIVVTWYSILNWSNKIQTTCTMKDSEGFI